MTPTTTTAEKSICGAVTSGSISDGEAFQLVDHDSWFLNTNVPCSHVRQRASGMLVTSSVGSVGAVVESRNPRFAKGDTVIGLLNWASHTVHDGKGLRKIDPAAAPLQARRRRPSSLSPRMERS